MNEELSRMFGDLIEQEIKNLSSLNPGTQEYERAVEGIAKLYKLKIDEVKNQWEYSEKFERSEKELKLKEVQLEEQRMDRWIKLGVDGAAIVLPLAFYGIWMGLGFKFEENGVFKSRTFQTLFNKFRTTR